MPKRKEQSTTPLAQSKEKKLPQTEIDPNNIPGGVIQISEAVENFSPNSFTQTEAETQKMSDAEVTVIADKVSAMYGIHRITALNSICEIIRKGGANNVTPGSFHITVQCPEEKIEAEIQKRDIIRCIEIVTPNRTFRDLANTLAETIVKSGIKRTEAFPGKDFSGDLAKKISVRLAFKNQPPLTTKERVGCASYAQNIPNLNELTGSDRLSSLLAEDLEIRRNSAKEKNKTDKNQKKTENKKFSETPRKNTKEKTDPNTLQRYQSK
jgi:hypothetical protein